MNKINTFLKYYKDFIKWKEYHFIFTSIRYILLRKTSHKSRIYKSSLGTFLVRKGTIDFQFANYAYEWNVKKFVYKHIKDYNVFLDIGSNIGTYSILFAGKGLRGYAFEPILSNFDATKTNLALNGLDKKVKVFNVALGREKGSGEFTFDVLNTGASHKIGVELSENLDDEVMLIESNIVPLDDLIREMDISKDDRIFIKIDVEGMEEEVLQGAKEFLRTFPNIMIVMESVHSGKEKLLKNLNDIAPFEILDVDDLNMGARKIVKH